MDVHYYQSIGMEARLSALSVGGLNSSLGGASKCITCPAGYHQNAEQTDCLPCPNGTYSHAGSVNCTTCPVGYYASRVSTSYYHKTLLHGWTVITTRHYCMAGQ